MKSNVKWEEFTHHVDRLIHEHGNYMVPTFIFIAALVFLGIGYLATHKLPEGEEQKTIQEIRQ